MLFAPLPDGSSDATFFACSASGTSEGKSSMNKTCLFKSDGNNGNTDADDCTISSPAGAALGVTTSGG